MFLIIVLILQITHIHNGYAASSFKGSNRSLFLKNNSIEHLFGKTEENGTDEGDIDWYNTLRIAAESLQLFNNEVSIVERILHTEMEGLLENERWNEVDNIRTDMTHLTWDAMESISGTFQRTTITIEDKIMKMQEELKKREIELLSASYTSFAQKAVSVTASVATATSAVKAASKFGVVSLRSHLRIKLQSVLANAAMLAQSVAEAVALVIKFEKPIFLALLLALSSATGSISAIAGAMALPSASKEVKNAAENAAHTALRMSRLELKGAFAVETALVAKSVTATNSAVAAAECALTVSAEENSKFVLFIVTSALATAAAATMSTVAALADELEIIPGSPVAYSTTKTAFLANNAASYAVDKIKPELQFAFQASFVIFHSFDFGFSDKISAKAKHQTVMAASEAAIFLGFATELVAKKAKEERSIEAVRSMERRVQDSIKIYHRHYLELMKRHKNEYNTDFYFSLILYLVSKTIVANAFSFTNLKANLYELELKSKDFCEPVINSLLKILKEKKKEHKLYQTDISFDGNLLYLSNMVLHNMIKLSKLKRYFIQLQENFLKIHNILKKKKLCEFIPWSAKKNIDATKRIACERFLKYFVKMRMNMLFLFILAEKLNKEMDCCNAEVAKLEHKAMFYFLAQKTQKLLQQLVDLIDAIYDKQNDIFIKRKIGILK